MFSLYGIHLALTLLLGFLFVRYRAKKTGIQVEQIDNLALIVSPFVLIGARIHHLITDWEMYQQQPELIWQVWHGGLGLWGALAGGFLAAGLYLYMAKISWHIFLQTISLPLFLVIGIGRWANVWNQELLPYAYYESVAVLALCVVLFALERVTQKTTFPSVFFIGILYYSLIRFFLEYTRLEPKIPPLMLTINQHMSLLVAIVSILVWYRFRVLSFDRSGQ